MDLEWRAAPCRWVQSGLVAPGHDHVLRVCPVCDVQIGLGTDDALDGTILELVGVFHWQERISFLESPCLYYPWGDSTRLNQQAKNKRFCMQVPAEIWMTILWKDTRIMTDGNRAVVFANPQDMQVENLDFPKLEMPDGAKAPHGVILKIVATNICGSDLHIYRGSFPVPQGMVMGHEMTGQVVELGSDVTFLKEGDLVSVPFNVACGRCRNCRARRTEICETTNPDVACAAYGFNLGNWQGGQAEYLFVPYADFQLLRFPDKDQAMEKIRDLALLSDILPTAFHGLMEAGAKPGSTVYIAGAGPVGRCGAAAARLLGASCIIVGDYHKDRLDLMKQNGCETIDLNEDVPLTDQIEAILGEPMVDCAVDYVGSEAHGIGRDANDMDPAHAINQVMDATRPGGATGIIGVYGPDPLAESKAEQEGTFPLDFGKAWIKSPRISGGQAPIMHYNRELMMAILWDRMPYLSDMLNTKIISLDDAPDAYATFDQGVSDKFIIDPHGLIPA